MENRVYGWRPGLRDQRDFVYASIRKAVELPEFVDLRAKCSPVENQGNLGSCTANAGVGLIEYLDGKDDGTYTELSRLFLYYNTRLIEGSVSYDSGCTIRGTMKSLFKYGVCPESRWPYRVLKYKTKPNTTSYNDATKRKIPGYYALRTLGEIKASLAEGVPVIFGFTVYDSFESEEVERTGILNMPLPDEEVLGGHACLIVGYINDKKVFIVRNSYGKNWGDQGHFYMPYEFVTSKLAEDFYTIR